MAQTVTVMSVVFAQMNNFSTGSSGRSDQNKRESFHQ